MSFLQLQPKNLTDNKKGKYAYMTSSQWNTNKKRSEQNRLYIGRLDVDKTNIIEVKNLPVMKKFYCR